MICRLPRSLATGPVVVQGLAVSTDVQAFVSTAVAVLAPGAAASRRDGPLAMTTIAGRAVTMIDTLTAPAMTAGAAATKTIETTSAPAASPASVAAHLEKRTAAGGSLVAKVEAHPVIASAERHLARAPRLGLAMIERLAIVLHHLDVVIARALVARKVSIGMSLARAAKVLILATANANEVRRVIEMESEIAIETGTETETEIAIGVVSAVSAATELAVENAGRETTDAM